MYVCTAVIKAPMKTCVEGEGGTTEGKDGATEAGLNQTEVDRNSCK